MDYGEAFKLLSDSERKLLVDYNRRLNESKLCAQNFNVDISKLGQGINSRKKSPPRRLNPVIFNENAKSRIESEQSPLNYGKFNICVHPATIMERDTSAGKSSYKYSEEEQSDYGTINGLKSKKKVCMTSIKTRPNARFSKERIPLRSRTAIKQIRSMERKAHKIGNNNKQKIGKTVVSKLLHFVGKHIEYCPSFEAALVHEGFLN